MLASEIIGTQLGSDKEKIMTKLFTGPHAATLTEFYHQYYTHLQWQLREWYGQNTPDLPFSENAANNELIDTLNLIATAAETGTTDDPEQLIEAINELLQSQPPARLLTPAFTWLLIQAECAASGDEVITQAEASKRFGVQQRTLSNWVKRGHIRGIVDPDEPNPTRATRVLASEVERRAAL
jgi:hypothetical protein